MLQVALRLQAAWNCTNTRIGFFTRANKILRWFAHRIQKSLSKRAIGFLYSIQQVVSIWSRGTRSSLGLHHQALLFSAACLTWWSMLAAPFGWCPWECCQTLGSLVFAASGGSRWDKCCFFGTIITLITPFKLHFTTYLHQITLQYITLQWL